MFEMSSNLENDIGKNEEELFENTKKELLEKCDAYMSKIYPPAQVISEWLKNNIYVL